MSSEDEKVESEIKYAWRPATRADIGSVARFGQVRSPHEHWSYGILVDVEQDKFAPDTLWVYVCKHSADPKKETEDFYVCEIQYVADDEP